MRSCHHVCGHVWVKRVVRGSLPWSSMIETQTSWVAGVIDPGTCQTSDSAWEPQTGFGGIQHAINTDHVSEDHTCTPHNHKNEVKRRNTRNRRRQHQQTAQSLQKIHQLLAQFLLMCRLEFRIGTIKGVLKCCSSHEWGRAGYTAESTTNQHTGGRTMFCVDGRICSGCDDCFPSAYDSSLSRILSCGQGRVFG